jgi:hypothetical protein
MPEAPLDWTGIVNRIGPSIITRRFDAINALMMSSSADSEIKGQREHIVCIGGEGKRSDSYPCEVWR